MEDLLSLALSASESTTRFTTFPKGTIFENVENTSDEKPQDGGTWIDYWERWTNNSGKYHCPGCDKVIANKKNIYEQADGAHVSIKGKEYIVPMCHACNCRFSESFSSVCDFVGVEIK